MSRATPDALDGLHGLLAGALADELEAALKARRDCGTPIPSALFNSVIKFLKDNGIDAPAASSRFDPIVDKLREMDPDDLAQARFN